MRVCMISAPVDVPYNRAHTSLSPTRYVARDYVAQQRFQGLHRGAVVSDLLDQPKGRTQMLDWLVA
jgi:hypothetical protein